jgi:hypothetical protein
MGRLLLGLIVMVVILTYLQQGGSVTYMDPASLPLVNAATAKFAANVTDPKASILNTVAFYQGAVSIIHFPARPSDRILMNLAASREHRYVLRWPDPTRWNFRRILEHPLCC